jgi:hypothetical protein
MPWTFRSLASGLLIAALATGSASCKTAEQKMVEQVEQHRERGRYDAALDYLEKYLAKYSDSLSAWRYRVLIRLDQEKRAEAAAEYSALNAALARHEPAILREVVLGAGGRWLVSDYASLARCGSDHLAGVAFFEDVLTPKLLSEGSMTKVAVRPQEIAAVIDALPGNLNPEDTWALISKYGRDSNPDLQARAVRAAGRHIAMDSLGAEAVAEAIQLIQTASASSSEELREAALLAAIRLPEGPGKEEFLGGLVAALADAGDTPRALTLALIGPRWDGAGGWTPERFKAWAAEDGPLRIVGVAGLASEKASGKRLKELRAAAEGGDAGEKFTAAAMLDALKGVKGADWKGPKAAWKAADVEARRAWASVFVRGRGKDRLKWVMAILADSDALVTQAATVGLAVPGIGADVMVDRALEQALQVDDAATRAGAAAAAVIRGSDGLALAVEGLFSAGDDRVMNDVLHAIVGDGSDRWRGAIELGLKAETPTVREIAVDAAAATCSTDNKPLMEGLLTDEDPHVAVRAASALYLLVGAEPPKEAPAS